MIFEKLNVNIIRNLAELDSDASTERACSAPPDEGSTYFISFSFDYPTRRLAAVQNGLPPSEVNDGGEIGKGSLEMAMFYFIFF